MEREKRIEGKKWQEHVGLSLSIALKIPSSEKAKEFFKIRRCNMKFDVVCVAAV